MLIKALQIKNIPALLWGEKSDKIYIFVHGKMSSKMDAADFAQIAIAAKYQVLSFDLPEHGDREQQDYPCNVWNGIYDLTIISDYVQKRWSNISLFAVSLGAYFSLLSYKNLPLKKCLFLSPILDMEFLIKSMLQWFDFNEELLRDKKILPTPIGETLYWDYYCYVKEHPIEMWNITTEILYGSADNLANQEIIDKFTQKFSANVTILQDGEHYFHTEEQLNFLKKWLLQHINHE